MSYIPQAIRTEVLLRDGPFCRHCEQHVNAADPHWQRRPSKPHMDHLIPQTFGGPHEIWNLAVACPRCNLSRQHREFNVDLIADQLLREIP